MMTGITLVSGTLAAALLAGCTGSRLGIPLAVSHADAGARAPRDLFVADLAGNVLQYTDNIHQQNPPLLGEITQGVSRSTAVWMDRHGTLYVLNSGGSATSIEEYKKGRASPFKTITDGLVAPAFIAVDGAGNLYADQTSSDGIAVLVYRHGAKAPTQTIDIPIDLRRVSAGGFAFDPKGDLLVAGFSLESNAGAVFSIAPGSSQAVNLNLQNPPGPSLGTDKAGYIYVGGHEGAIAIYPPGSTTPSRLIDLDINGFYTGMTVLADGTIYWPNFDNSTMYEFAPGGSEPLNVFDTQGSGVDVAVGPP